MATKSQPQTQDTDQALQELYVHQLKDLYSAEAQITKALPKMAKAARNPQLKKVFEMHLKQTTRQRDDVEKLLAKHGEKAKGHTCKGMQGIIEEGQETIEMHKKSPPQIADAALIGAAQRVEHYEIAGYGTARTTAELLGDQRAVKVLDRIAEEEGNTDKRLTAVALETMNGSVAA